jgi:hypothetical protein
MNKLLILLHRWRLWPFRQVGKGGRRSNWKRE